MSNPDQVSAAESAFLDLERPGLPMNVGALLLVEGDRPLAMSDMHHLMASRIVRLPRFRQTPQAHRWVRVRRIDFTRHLFHHVLPRPGRRSDLLELCAHIHEQPLSRRRPLWEMHLIDGVHGGHQALLLKTHHAITDGLAGVAVAEALFDRTPGGDGTAERPPINFIGPARNSALGAAQALLGIAMTAAGGLIAQPGPFNGPVGQRRSFATCDIPLSLVRHAKHRFGGTFDDIVVAIVAAGLRRYLGDARYPDPPRALRAMLPVSTNGSRPGAMGNHVTAIFVDLPMEFGDMEGLVHSLAANKSVLRAAHTASGAELVVRASGLLPDPVHHAVMRLAGGLRSSNLVLSDVPAPDAPMFVAGRRIIGTYPLMPLGGDIGLSIAVMGMAGKLGVGITADPDLVPSADHIADAIRHVIADLVHDLYRPHADREAA